MQDSIFLSITLTVPQSDVAYAPEYDISFETDVSFLLRVGDCDTELDLATKVFCAREFFSTGGTEYNKPFHPHTQFGMYNWTNRRPVVRADDGNPTVLIFGDIKSVHEPHTLRGAHNESR